MPTQRTTFFSVDEAAAKLNVSPRRVHQFIAEKRLRAERLGRAYLIPKESLDEFAKQDRPLGRPRNRTG